MSPRRVLIISALLASATFASGCVPDLGLGFGQGSKDDEEPAEVSPCKLAKPLEKDARAMEHIALQLEVDGVKPEDHSPLQPATIIGEVTFEGHEATGYVPVYWDSEEDEWYFIAPPHRDWRDGGDVTIEFIGDGFRCPEQPLEIEPLQAAPGYLEDVTEKYRELAEVQAGQFGMDAATLRATPFEQVPLPLLNTRMLLVLLDDEKNPYSLGNFATLSTPEGDAWEESLSFYEALLAEVDYVGMLEETIESAEAVPTLENPTFLRILRQSDTIRQPLSPCAAAAEILIPEIKIASQLSSYMHSAQVPEKVMSSNAWKAAGLAQFAGGFSADPLSQAANQAGGLLLLLQEKAYTARMKLYPTRITRADATVDRDEFEEDSEEEGTWSDYDVDAASEDYRMDQEALDIFIRSLKNLVAAGASKKFGNAAKKSEVGSEEFFDRDFAIEGATKSAEVLLSELPEEFQGECFIPAQQFKDISLDNKLWHEVDHEGSIQKGETRYNYKPKTPGLGRLILRPPANAFPPAINGKRATLELPVEVKAIEVHLDPNRRYINPTEKIDITANVENAVDRGIEWKVEPDEVELEELDPDSEGNPKARLSVPRELEDETLIVVTARSTSEQGIRDGKSKSDPRYGQGFYTNKIDVVVWPNHKCLKVGDEAQFEADVVGLQEDEVTWTRTGGTINSSGKYTATKKGTFKVTATAKEDPTKKDSATVKVANCDCEWNVRVTGPVSGAWGGTNTMSAGYFGNLNVTMYNLDSNFAGSIAILPGILPDRSLGTYPATFGGDANIRNDSIITRFHSFDDSGRLTVEDWDNLRMRARFKGNTHMFAEIFEAAAEGRDPVPVQVEATFDAVITNLVSNPFTLMNSCGNVNFTGDGVDDLSGL